MSCSHRLHSPGPTIALLAVLAVALVHRPVPAVAQVAPPGFQVDLITTQILGPISLAGLPDGRMLVTQRYLGQLRMIKDSALLAKPVADFDTNTCRERGLLGVVIDPDFTTNQWVYCFYSKSSLPGMDTTVDSLIVDNRVVRITLDGDSMLTGSEVLIRSLPTDPKLCQHIAGNMRFAPDGTLLVAYGDGQTYPGPALDLTSLRGKLLRLDPATGQAAPDNAFALDGDPATLPEIWAYGLRNSFDFALDRITGQVYATENSDAYDDEINLLTETGDYGYPVVVGNADTQPELDYQAAHPAYRNPLWASGTPSVCPTGIVAVDADRWNGLYARGLFFAECKIPYRIRHLPLNAAGTLATDVATDFITDSAAPVIGLAFDVDDNLWFTKFNSVYRVRYLPVAGVGEHDGFFLAHGGAHPARGTALLRWSLPVAGEARLSMRDVRGRAIRVLERGTVEAGIRTTTWDGRDEAGHRMPPGMYFARLVQGGAARSLPILLLD